MEKNKKTSLICVLVFLIMLGIAYLFPSLYNLFCQVTGFDGTTQIAARAPDHIVQRDIKVIFTATTHPDLPWEFKPKQKSMTVKVGEEKLAFYTAKNISQKPVKGMALFNVSPNKMGQYFSKIECFCFEEQLLQPGEEIDMPVSFFIDPDIMNEPLMDEVSQVYLNYIFHLKK